MNKLNKTLTGLAFAVLSSTSCDCFRFNSVPPKYAAYYIAATNFPVPNGFPYSNNACSSDEPDGKVARVSSPKGFDGILNLGEFVPADGNIVTARLGSELKDSIVKVSLVQYVTPGDAFIPIEHFVKEIIVPADGNMKEYSFDVSSVLNEINGVYYVGLTNRGKDSSENLNESILDVDWVGIR